MYLPLYELLFHIGTRQSNRSNEEFVQCIIIGEKKSSDGALIDIYLPDALEYNLPPLLENVPRDILMLAQSLQDWMIEDIHRNSEETNA